MNSFTHIPEPQLYAAVRLLLSNPSRIFSTADGKRLQVLAPGRMNVHEGPDLLDMALLVGGEIYIGNAEFHRRSSDWLRHGHDADVRYHNLVLHIVLEDDVPIHSAIATIVIDSDEMQQALDMQAERVEEVSADDIHTYSLLRLLRMTAEHKELLRGKTITEACTESVRQFIQKYEAKRRRPTYTTERLGALLASLSSSGHTQFIASLPLMPSQHIASGMQAMVRTKIADEGAQLRREIVINALMPLALAIALVKDETRIGIFEWYWSVPAIGQYGVLKRAFPTIPQRYLWQQQGMLEILREKRADVSAHETSQRYGLVQSLHFYKMALETPELEERP